MKTKTYLAVDLGAESGRVMACRFDGGTMRFEEIHRFVNGPVKVRGSLQWDLLRMFAEIKKGISLAAKSHGPELAGLGVDTWGVDYGLLGRDDLLLGNPFHYRDSRTDGMMDEAFRRLPKRDLYAHTGIQFMFFNTVFQVLSEILHKSSAISAANRLLFIPDLVNFWLTGVQVNERTIASTSQVYNPVRKDWAPEVIEALGLPRHIFGEIVDPGTVLGELLPEVVEETGSPALRVIAPACHDTGSAVAAVPAEGTGRAYISSGTWSLMGVESPRPIITDTSFKLGFTNEVGVCDTIRLLKNISGLWIVQECKRTWQGRGKDYSYAELAELAGEAKPFQAVINPDAADFIHPGDMPARILAFCKRTGQVLPEDPGSVIRTVLESLALRYRVVFGELEELVGGRIEVLHIVGGGAKNDLLNQLAANSTKRPVVTGPVEATSAGNVLMQMIGNGDLASIGEGRELIRRSFETRTCEPVEPASWDAAFERFLRVQDAAKEQAGTG